MWSQFSRKDSKRLKRILETNDTIDVKDSDRRHKRRKRTTTDDTLDDRRHRLATDCLSRLSSARFRDINHRLYTCGTSETSFLTKDLFQTYHKTYEELAQKWPINPIEFVVQKLEPKVKSSAKRLVMADIGCGPKPRLKMAFPSQDVHSFDLVSCDPRITSANMASLPLADGACDVGVFCLSLMASELKDVLFESNRVLNNNALLIVVDVVSRFDGKEDFAKSLAKFGFEELSRERLPPNDFFVYFEFSKRRSLTSKSRLPSVALLACEYKKR